MGFCESRVTVAGRVCHGTGRFLDVAHWLEEGAILDAGVCRGTVLAYALRFDRLDTIVRW